MSKLLTALLLATAALSANAATVITNEEASEVCEVLVQSPVTQAQIKVFVLTLERTGNRSKAYHAAIRFPGEYMGSAIVLPNRYKYFELLESKSMTDVTAEIKSRCVEQVQSNNSD